MHVVPCNARAHQLHRARCASAAQRLCPEAAQVLHAECPAFLSAAAAPVAQRWASRCCVEAVRAKAVAGRPSFGGRLTTEHCYQCPLGAAARLASPCLRADLGGQGSLALCIEPALRSPAGRQRRPAQPGVQHGRATAGCAGFRTPVNAITLDRMALPQAIAVHGRSARCSRLAPSPATSARRCIEGADLLRSAPRCPRAWPRRLLGLPRPAQLGSLRLVPTSPMQAIRPNVGRGARVSFFRGSLSGRPTLCPMRPTRPNPSLHLTFNSRLRRLLPAGELQR